MKKTYLGFIIFLLLKCANPVGPTGGDKDVDAPKIVSVQKINSGNQTEINILFNENINTKGEITLSPYTKKENVILEKHRHQLKFSVPKNTNAISLNDVISDVNENNIGNYPFIILGNDSFNFVLKYECQNITKDKIKGYIKIDSFYYLANSSQKKVLSFGGLKNIKQTFFVFNDLNNNAIYDPNEEYYYNNIESNQLYKDSVNDTLSIRIYPPKSIEIKKYYNRKDSMAIYSGIPNYIINTMKQDKNIDFLNHLDTTVISLNDSSEFERYLISKNNNIKFINAKIEIQFSNTPIYTLLKNESDTIVRKTYTLGRQLQQYKLYNLIGYKKIQNPRKINLSEDIIIHKNTKNDSLLKKIKYKISTLNINVKNKVYQNLKIRLIDSKNIQYVYPINENTKLEINQDTYKYCIWEDSNNNNQMDIFEINDAVKAENIIQYYKETSVNSKLDNTIIVE